MVLCGGLWSWDWTPGITLLIHCRGALWKAFSYEVFTIYYSLAWECSPVVSRLGPQLCAIRDTRTFKRWSLVTDLQVTRGVTSLWTLVSLSLSFPLDHKVTRNPLLMFPLPCSLLPSTKSSVASQSWKESSNAWVPKHCSLLKLMHLNHYNSRKPSSTASNPELSQYITNTLSYCLSTVLSFLQKIFNASESIRMSFHKSEAGWHIRVLFSCQTKSGKTDEKINLQPRTHCSV